MAPRSPSRHWLGLILALLVGGLLGGLHLAGRLPSGLEEIEATTLDWRFRLRGPLPPPDQVAIIAVDDRTLAKLGRWPLPRATLAEAVTRLRAAGARTIGLDLLLLEREPPSDGITLSAGDRALRAVLAEADDVVLGMALLFDGAAQADPGLEQELLPHALRIVARPPRSLPVPGAAGALVPIQPLRDVAGLGHVNLLLREGQPRLAHPAIALGSLLISSFPLELARRQRGLPADGVALSLAGELALGARRIALDRSLGLPVDFHGPAGTIATWSLLDLLEDRIPPSALEGRAVLVGATALGVGDTFPTPFAQSLPGVEVLATAVDNLLQPATLIRPVGLLPWEAGLCLLLAVLTWAGLRLPNPRVAALAGTALLLLWLAACHAAFVLAKVWVNATVPALAIVLSGLLLAASRAAFERRMRREAERQRGNLARYVSPVMAAQLAEEERPSFDEREQAAAILFFDLSGFTRLAEGRPPTETARFLKDFHARLETVVLHYEGVVEQFLGDGAMIIFGLPQEWPDDPVRALACARALVVELGAWRPELKPRAGLHFGRVAMARLGGRSQAQLAAAGDTVNVGARLEALARQLGAALAVSDALVEAVRAAGRADLLAGLQPEGAQDMRGRTGQVAVWLAQRELL